MQRTVRNEALKYRNEAFAIHHLITDCPPPTVIRELLKNAEENATQLRVRGRIEWFAEVVGSAPKLGLFNEGPGMSASELSKLMDLASSGKTLGLDSNFGQGGKISALKVSPYGVIYRSCKKGRVSEIVLAAEQHPELSFPLYVKKRRPVTDEEGLHESWEVVLDVTERYVDRDDRPVNRDWTEVLLLGESESHDTVNELLPDLQGKNWLMRLINRRFYRFAKRVSVSCANTTTGSVAPRSASGCEELTLKHCVKDGRYEDVPAVHPRLGPVTIRYCKLRGSYGFDQAGENRAKTMQAYGLGSRGDHVCVVWRDECYEMLTGWSRVSGAFGVSFGSSNVAIHVLLPDDAPVKNNTYRSSLLEKEGHHQTIRIEEFADVVRTHRPEWLIQYVEEESRKNVNHGGVMARLRRFLNELKATSEPRTRLEATNGASASNGTKPSTTAIREIGVDPFVEVDPAPITETNGNGHAPTPSRKMSANRRGIPTVTFTEDPAILDEMLGRAALYRRDENVVLLNPHHFKYEDDLQRMLEDVGADAQNRAFAMQLFDEEYCFNAGKYVVLSMLFKGKAEWSDREWEESLSMSALTVYLAEPSSLEEARRRFRQRMNSRKIEDLSREEG